MVSSLNFQSVIELAAKYTVARMLEREDFAKRYHENLPTVSTSSFILSCGYDSVHLQADINRRNRSKFNLLMGRTLQKEYGQEPQIALMMPILEGLDGVQKRARAWVITLVLMRSQKKCTARSCLLVMT